MKRLIGGGGGGNAAGGASGNTQVQFNDNGAFGGDADLTWNKTTNVLDVGGDVVLDDGGTYTTTLQTITATANRTISLPDATGTVALVAGSSGQITYNNAGANAGVSTFTADSSGRLTNSASSAASLPVKLWNGTIFAGTTPHVLIQPSTASAGSWSASGTALGVNTAAAFGGNLLDLQVNGTSVARCTSAGRLNLTTLGLVNGVITTWSNGATVSSTSGEVFAWTNGEIRLNGATAFGWAPAGATAAGADTGLTRSAAGVVKVTNGSTGDGTISGQHRLVGTAPATASSTGTAGDIRYDASYIYICTATDTWKRTAISTW